MNTHLFWVHFRWLLIQSLSIMQLPIVRWIVALFVICSIVSLIWQRPFEAEHWKRSYWLVFTQSLVLISVIAVGVLFRATTNHPLRPIVNPVGDQAVNVLFFVSLALGFFLVYRTKGCRWLAFCLVSLQELFVLSALFIAGMSVTGDWL